MWRRTFQRKRPIVGALLLGLALTSCAQPSSPSVGFTPAASPTGAGPPLVRANVVKVLDADSIEMRLDDGRNLHVQLIGIDGPDAGKPFRGRANDFVRSKLRAGRGVFLEQGPMLWDGRGRYLAYVWLKRPTRGTIAETSTTMLNAMMLSAGWAEIEGAEANPKYGTLFRQLQQEARRAKRGIWS